MPSAPPRPHDSPPRPGGVRALIDRIADALGEEATPDRVERVARAVLDPSGTSGQAADAPGGVAGQGGPASPPPRPAPDRGRGGDGRRGEPGRGGPRVVVTAYGRDTPGVLAALTAELAAADANLLDVSQKILQGYFTVVLVADLPAGADLGAARDRLQARGETFGARVLLQHEDLFQAMHRP